MKQFDWWCNARSRCIYVVAAIIVIWDFGYVADFAESEGDIAFKMRVQVIWYPVKRCLSGTAEEKEENIRTILQSTDLISPPQLFPFIDNL